MKQGDYFFLLGLMILWAVLGVGEGWASSPSAKPIEELLLPDGSLDLSSGYTGNLDPSGYTWYTDSQGKPHFVRSPLFQQQNENWSDLFALPGCDEQVFALQLDPSGHLYVGGSFSIAGTAFSPGIAMWDGSKWNSLGTGLSHSTSSAACFAIAIDASGVVYVGGYFTHAGGVAANSIAKWDPTTSTWSSLGSGIKLSTGPGYCYALRLDGKGKLYVGGNFDTAGEVSAGSIAVWDIASSSWSNPFGIGLKLTTIMNGFANDIEIDENGIIYVGGGFRYAGGNSVNNIAKWDGSTWSGIGNGFNFQVKALIVESSNSIYAGGDFTSSGGSPVYYIAKWNGTTWSNLGPGVNSKVKTLIKIGSDLYAGGDFTATYDNSIILRCVAKWDGSNWSPVGLGFTGGLVYSLIAYGSTLYAGGSFNATGGVPINFIAQWSGTEWIPVCTSQQYGMRGNYVRALAVIGNLVYVGGDFSQGGRTFLNDIGLLDQNTNTWQNIGSANNRVNAILWDGSNLYVGGYFTQIGDAFSCNYVARYDGVHWSVMESGRSNVVFALAKDGSGNLYAGGLDGVGQWNGSTWTELGTIAAGDTIFALAVIGSTLYVGGNFTQIGGVSANYLAKWDGGSWTAVDPVGMNGPVRALAVHGTDLIAGGLFTTAGGTTVNYLARWDGNTWHAFGTGMNGPVYALHSYGGILYVGGAFTQAEGHPVNGIASWNGSTWTGYGDGIQIGKAVYAIGVGNEGIYIGGSFLTVGGKVSSLFGKRIFSSNVLLETKVFLEGPYSASANEMTTTLNSGGYIPLTSPYPEDPRTVSSIPANVTDWVLVQLRSTPTGSAVVSKSVFIHKDGRLVADDGTTGQISLSVFPGTYYIVIKHRNHLAVMSKNPVELNGSSSTPYNFTTGTDKYYGTQAKLIDSDPVTYGMYTGDANRNGQVQLDDKNSTWRSQLGMSGYRSADFNLNGQVQLDDKNSYWRNNIGRGTQVP